MDDIREWTIRRGDIFFADFGHTVGSEQSGVRPVLAVQNNVGNRYSPTIIVAPMTSKAKKMEQPTHVEIGEQFGLNESSVILLEQIRTIDRGRIISYVGHVDGLTMASVNRALRVSLGLY